MYGIYHNIQISDYVPTLSAVWSTLNACSCDEKSPLCARSCEPWAQLQVSTLAGRCGWKMVGASFLVDPAVSVRTESKASKINVKQFFLYCFFPGIYRMCLVVSHSKMFCLWMSLPETGPKGQYFGMRRSHQWCMGFLHWKWRFKGHNKVMALNTYKWAYSDIPNLSYRSYMSICNCEWP